MPHQCLNCGKVFEDGSADILKGCPVCGGKKFFYTKKPLSEKERQKLLKESEVDMESINEIIKARADEKSEEEWLHIEPKNIKELLKEIGKKKEEIEKSISKQDSEVESISVEKVGEYRINLKKLMDDESIIIQKDGSYMIHLPSLLTKGRSREK